MLPGSIPSDLRRVPLDGALLWFSPKTGTNLRLDHPSTQHLRSRAPRAVLFGITNHCNMQCSFCSRDLDAASDWTPETAFVLLRDLADRGVLEVAFGGGEPLAFRDFDTLVERLGRETPLAVHLTTNGVLLNEERLEALLPWIGEFRLSVYDDNPWPQRVAMLAARGARFGVNVVVTAERLGSLPGLLAHLESLNCQDVALLRYVGADTRLQITRAHEPALRHAILASRMRVRLAVCFNDLLQDIPRMWSSGDCNAGSDFITITPDQRIKPCSFHASGLKVTTANEVIELWEALRAARHPAPQGGCARPLSNSPPADEGLRVWHGFSANNSGDCVLVGRFEQVEDAERLIADLLPGFRGGEKYSNEWTHVLAREQISTTADSLEPQSMAHSGRAVLFHTDMAADDDFPELRTLVWRRGGVVVYNGIHEHDPVHLLAGLRFRNEEDLTNAEIALCVDDMSRFERKGLELFSTFGLAEPGYESGLVERLRALEAIAIKHSGVVAAELIATPEQSVPLAKPFAQAMEAYDRTRLWITFRSPERAQAFASKLSCKHAAAGHYVVLESSRTRPRYGYLAHRYDGVCTAVDGERMRIQVSFWAPEREREVDPGALALELRVALSVRGEVHLAKAWHSTAGHVETVDPFTAVPEIVSFAQAKKLNVSLDAQPHNAVAQAIARIGSDLHLLQRKQRGDGP